MEPTNFERLISKRVALGAVRDSVAVVCIERHGATAEQKPAPRSSPPHPRLLPYGVPSQEYLARRRIGDIAGQFAHQRFGPLEGLACAQRAISRRQQPA